jgi:hypothetical protein
MERALVEIETEKLSEPWVLLYESEHLVTGIAEQAAYAQVAGLGPTAT